MDVEFERADTAEAMAEHKFGPPSDDLAEMSREDLIQEIRSCREEYGIEDTHIHIVT